MRINAIDSSGIAGALGFARMSLDLSGEIVIMRKKRMNSIISEIINVAGASKISRLNIMDHGSYGSFEMGDEVIDLDNFSNHRSNFERLQGRFEDNGQLHLMHCYIGNSDFLLRWLARATGATVYACVGLTNPATGRNVEPTEISFKIGSKEVFKAPALPWKPPAATISVSPDGQRNQVHDVR